MALNMAGRYHASACSVSSMSSGYSDLSEDSQSTAPTICSGRPTLHNYDGGIAAWATGRKKWQVSREDDIHKQACRSVDSVATYASTVASEHEAELYEAEACPVNPELEDHYGQDLTWSPSGSLASCPQDFAYYFPSTRKLQIRHPDNCTDGNRNLSITTEAQACDPSDPSYITTAPLTLFHLCLKNLKTREFSLHRYCRQSGREICHSTRRYTRPATEKQSGLHRSFGNAITFLKASTSPKKSSRTSLKRTDSGYSSLGSPPVFTPQRQKEITMDGTSRDVEVDAPEPETAKVLPKASNLLLPTNTTKLEFSNYSHLDLKRRGMHRGTKRYEFSYWGTHYSWKRSVHKPATSTCKAAAAASLSSSTGAKIFEYHLHDTLNQRVIAYVLPEPLSAEEAALEAASGGWVPRSMLTISDARALAVPHAADLADVIVATGLLALVDDCIKQRWDRKDRLLDRLPKAAKLPRLLSRTVSTEEGKGKKKRKRKNGGYSVSRPGTLEAASRPSLVRNVSPVL